MEHGHTSAAGPAVLELGRDVGAAVVYTTAALDHAEIEIRPRHGQWDGTHTAVRKRASQPPVYAALFFGMPAGEYHIRVRGKDPHRSIRIVGGEVTEHHGVAG